MGHSGAVRDTAEQFEYEFFYSEILFSYRNISALGNQSEIGLYSKFVYEHQFSEEKMGLKICHLVV